MTEPMFASAGGEQASSTQEAVPTAIAKGETLLRVADGDRVRAQVELVGRVRPDQQRRALQHRARTASRAQGPPRSAEQAGGGGSLPNMALRQDGVCVASAGNVRDLPHVRAVAGLLAQRRGLTPFQRWKACTKLDASE